MDNGQVNNEIQFTLSEFIVHIFGDAWLLNQTATSIPNLKLDLFKMWIKLSDVYLCILYALHNVYIFCTHICSRKKSESMHQINTRRVKCWDNALKNTVLELDKRTRRYLYCKHTYRRERAYALTFDYIGFKQRHRQFNIIKCRYSMCLFRLWVAAQWRVRGKKA